LKSCQQPVKWTLANLSGLRSEDNKKKYNVNKIIIGEENA